MCGTAYLGDPLQNAIVNIPNTAPHATAVSRYGDDVVEVRTAGKQLRDLAIDLDRARDCAGAGYLFGLVVGVSDSALCIARGDIVTVGRLSS